MIWKTWERREETLHWPILHCSCGCMYLCRPLFVLLDLMPWLPEHLNDAICGQFHQTGANGHLCCPCCFRTSQHHVVLAYHSSYSFSKWFVLRGDTPITLALALGESHGQLQRSNPSFSFPLSLPFTLHHQLPSPFILHWPACFWHSTHPKRILPSQMMYLKDRWNELASTDKPPSEKVVCLSWGCCFACCCIF